ncbi:MAG: fold metallo-hydrolase [Marmoricola sp.]|nr:fold metallo-hydrolase [Marmoricola sp.]
MTTYTGNVAPGGTPDTRELSHLIITKLAVDEKMSNNCYVLRCRATDEQVLIDAADDAPALLSVLGTGRTTKVLTTHQHWDS